MSSTASAPEALRRYVRRIRFVRDVEHLTYERLPDGETELIVRFGGGDGASASVIGTRTCPLRKTSSGKGSALLVRFRAGGAYPFFGLPAAELTDRAVPLGELWDEAAFAGLDRVGAAIDAEREDAGAQDARRTIAAERAIVRALVDALERRNVYDPFYARHAHRALLLVRAAPEVPSARALAALVGTSERHLRRAFHDVVGLSPKQYLRVERLHRAFALADAAAHPNWGGIAARVGYYDQAHLIAESRALVGKTPSARAKG